jgi:hypothetical protein
MATSHQPIPTRKAQSLRSALGWGAVLAAIFGACGTFLWSTRPRPLHAEVSAVAYETAVAEMQTANEAATPKKPTRALSEAEKIEALGRIARVDRLLRDHARYLGEFPVGTNADITRALCGANLKKVVFVTADEIDMNGRGELIDDWRTPYFFHQVSGRQMEIYSAGPDGEMWTADDLKVTAR